MPGKVVKNGEDGQLDQDARAKAARYGYVVGDS